MLRARWTRVTPPLSPPWCGYDALTWKDRFTGLPQTSKTFVAWTCRLTSLLFPLKPTLCQVHKGCLFFYFSKGRTYLLQIHELSDVEHPAAQGDAPVIILQSLRASCHNPKMRPSSFSTADLTRLID